MKINGNRKELVERYLRAAWILKIRLMSSRRQLWDNQTSIIHIENSVLQIRKACESICHMSLVAAEIDLVDVSKTLYDKYDVGAIFKGLPETGALHFPRFSRLSLKEANKNSSTWDLIRHDFDPVDLDRLKRIFYKCGNILHENTIYKNFGFLTKGAVSNGLNALRADHQWLWNRFWHHSIVLKEHWFFVNLGDMTSAAQPTILKEEGFLQEDLIIDFDPDVIADFNGNIDWSQYEAGTFESS